MTVPMARGQPIDTPPRLKLSPYPHAAPPTYFAYFFPFTGCTGWFGVIYDGIYSYTMNGNRDWMNETE